MIFGNIPELLRIHESLLNELQIVIDELTIGKNRSLGKCFLNHTQREHFGKENGVEIVLVQYIGAENTLQRFFEDISFSRTNHNGIYRCRK